MLDPITCLERRVRSDGGSPLLTWRGLDDGGRVELSARTVANWADKVQWALDDAGVEPGDEVSIPVLAARPAHWGPLVFLLGIWQRGAVPTLGPADVVVAEPGAGGDLACSLHPLGLGSDVLAFPDVHAREPLADQAWAGTTWSGLDVAPSDGRRLVAGGEPWATALDAIVAPLLGGGSTVLLDGIAMPEVAALVAGEERVDDVADRG